MVVKAETQEETSRLSVTIEHDYHRRLKELANSHRPRLSLRYIIEYAIKDLLKKAEDPQFVLNFGDPLPNKDANEQT